MDKIRSLVVFSTIAIILLLVITEQTNAYGEDHICIGRCTPTCTEECMSQDYSTGDCKRVGTYIACCCVKKKK
ncbi:hypothetical protein EUTSA_v10022951mg [Eutrema salsugineum]|uniref:Knottin scorpion toxin-like domain-containing protein n=1 Tax=Eutrema salsugineum TaxID=72664 RepID=V4NVQ0_EUTSA|nr:hypothetical protein EUTSA_v10022951mg [Eutrema salsugineum]